LTVVTNYTMAFEQM